MRFRPCIDLHGGKVKQIVGGTLRDDNAGLRTNFVSEKSPAYYAELYRQYQLTGGHVIMLGAGNESAAREALAAWRGGLQIGGGITPANARSYLEAGAAQIIVTSYLIADGTLSEERLEALAAVVPREQLVIDLSARRTEDGYRVVYNRWQSFTDTMLTKQTLEHLSRYACEFLIHAVDMEGKCSGVDAELVKRLAAESPVPAVYAGGIASYDDVELIRTCGEKRVDFTVGSALDLFGGTLSFEKLVEMQDEAR